MLARPLDNMRGIASVAESENTAVFRGGGASDAVADRYAAVFMFLLLDTVRQYC